MMRRRRLQADAADGGPVVDSLQTCVPVATGTPHCDGVIRRHDEPAIIAICGTEPVGYALSNPFQPGWRAA